jgi:hypothetical protein
LSLGLRTASNPNRVILLEVAYLVLVIFTVISLFAETASSFKFKGLSRKSKTHKYIRRLFEKDEICKLQADPQELNNCIDDTQFKDILTSLKDRLLTFFLGTSDGVP